MVESAVWVYVVPSHTATASMDDTSPSSSRRSISGAVMPFHRSHHHRQTSSECNYSQARLAIEHDHHNEQQTPLSRGMIARTVCTTIYFICSSTYNVHTDGGLTPLQVNMNHDASPTTSPKQPSPNDFKDMKDSMMRVIDKLEACAGNW